MNRTTECGGTNGMLGGELLTDQDFGRLSRVIQQQLGIQTPPSKKSLVQSRILLRMRALRMLTCREYCNYLLGGSNPGEEMIHFLDVVTTNKTAFFREAGHFDFLLSGGLADVMTLPAIQQSHRIDIWSAPCSTGEEAFTLAIVVAEFLRSSSLENWDYSILGTDVSTRALETASQATYTHDDIEPIPENLRHRYLLKSRDQAKPQVRITRELRNHVTFSRLNFMSNSYGPQSSKAVIFCRNVLIYFDPPTQQKVIARLCSYLMPGGYLFIGMAESLHGMDLPLCSVGRSIYQKR